MINTYMAWVPEAGMTREDAWEITGLNAEFAVSDAAEIRDDERDLIDSSEEWMVEDKDGKVTVVSVRAYVDVVYIAEEVVNPAESAEVCRSTGVQNCHACDNLECGDNFRNHTSPVAATDSDRK